MDKKEILKKVDHTLLAQTATWEEIKAILDAGIQYETASACIPASYVKRAADYVQGKLKICTVIGFPNGYSTTAVKVFETKDAVANGAAEIDMVINIGLLKDGLYDELEDEIRKVHEACDGRILKVIIETCLLTEEEKKKMCEIVTLSGAEYIKTSTGFSTGGATFADIALMKEYVGEHVKIKAAGGIASFEDAEEFIRLGADRLGTSRLAKGSMMEMDTHMIVELIGYFSSLLVLVSFLMTSVIKLRIVNSVGAIIFTVYATIIGSYPTALMNLCLVGINMYNLYKLLKSPKCYEVINEEPEAAGLQYFLNHYADDIKKYFPEFKMGDTAADAAYMVVHDTVPAGVLLGKKKENGKLEILLDYTTPQYRDCSVGRYLYGELGGQGILKLSFPDAPEGHEDYLKKVGFVKENGVYERKI